MDLHFDPTPESGHIREAILEAGVRSLAANGYLQTRMRDVARLAHVTLAGVNHHFPTKEVLVDKVIERCVDVVAEVLREENAAAGPRPQDRIRATLESVWRLAKWPSAEVRVLMDLATQVPRSESLRAAVIRAFDTLAGELMLQIGPMDRAAERQALSNVLVSTLHGLVILDGYVGSRSGGESHVSALQFVAHSPSGS